MEENNNNYKRVKNDGKNPPGNLGALFKKKSSESGDDYFLIKVTLGENYTLVAFKNSNYTEGSKEPAFYIFPYKPKNNKENPSK